MKIYQLIHTVQEFDDSWSEESLGFFTTKELAERKLIKDEFFGDKRAAKEALSAGNGEFYSTYGGAECYSIIEIEVSDSVE